MVEYDTLETRLGEFEPKFHHFRDYEASINVIEYRMAGLEDKSFSDYVGKSAVAGEVPRAVDELMSQDYVPDRESEEFDEYFRNVTGVVGLEIGKNLDEEADATDIQLMAEGLYDGLSFLDNTDGGLQLFSDHQENATAGAYGHLKEEITAHLEDTIWLGYMDGTTER